MLFLSCQNPIYHSCFSCFSQSISWCFELRQGFWCSSEWYGFIGYLVISNFSFAFNLVEANWYLCWFGRQWLLGKEKKTELWLLCAAVCELIRYTILGSPGGMAEQMPLIQVLVPHVMELRPRFTVSLKVQFVNLFNI